jgi:SpoVK/Ycf46/Vps4 family AAA+-type ATPase
MPSSSPGICRLAEITAGYSGSDLRQLCVQAAMRPVRQLLEEEGRVSAEAQARTATHAKQQAATLPPGREGGDAGGAAVPVTEGEPGRLDGAAAAGGDGGGDGGGGGSRVRADSERAAASEASGFEGLQEEGERGASKECGGLGLVPSSEGRITPYAPQQLGQLLAAAEGIAGEAGSRREELRPTSMQVRANWVLRI